MAKKLLCPNCGSPVAKPNEGCVLHDLIQVVRERGNTPEKKLRKLHAGVHADFFWDHAGELADKLEEGYFSE
jgi:hypothetical protein